tara:strand:+ start:2700 stop:3092 length:393 start_codon:yes stop_codon:yes gene_type:complete
MTYIYSNDGFSDFHKEAYGFRPDNRQLGDWFNLTPAQKDIRWKELQEMVNDNEEVSINVQEACLERLKADIEQHISLGAKDRTEALLIMTKNEDFQTGQCVEAWVWGKGVLFTPYGKELVQELCKIVTYN